MNKSNLKKKSIDHHLVSHIVLILACITILYPFFVIIGASFQTPKDLAEHGYKMIPTEFSLEAYEMIFKNSGQLLNSYKVTTVVTLIGTILATLLTTSFAYVIARPTYRYRKILSFYVFFTMLFNGGLVANYIWLSGTLNLKNTYAVLILPLCVSPWNIIMMKGFMMGLPNSLPEAAKVDGASELKIFTKIVLPCSLPGVATITLFYALGYWNDWYTGMIYIDGNDLVGLQLLLQRIIKDIDFLNSTEAMSMGANTGKELPTVSARMAMCILAAGPMLLIFPFFQKYFRTGITIGSVKG